METCAAFVFELACPIAEGAMGYFDPGWKKMAARAPGYFQESAGIWIIAIEDVIARLKLDVRADMFKAAVIGHLAIEDFEKNPSAWSSEGLGFIKLKFATANQMLSQPHQLEALKTANVLRHTGLSP